MLLHNLPFKDIHLNADFLLLQAKNTKNNKAVTLFIKGGIQCLEVKQLQ